MSRKSVVISIVALLIAGFLLMDFLSSFKRDPEKVKRPFLQKVVDATVVHLGPIQTKIEAYGRVTSAQPVILYSEVEGVLLPGDVPFLPGQRFKRGELLLKIDDRQTRLDLNSAKSDFLNALANVLPEIRLDFPKQYRHWQEYFNNTDFDHPLQPLPQVSDQQVKMFLSRFNVYKLFFAVKNLEIRLEKHFIYAPFDGSIVSADLRAGSSARPGTKLGEILNLQRFEVEVPVPVQDTQWLDRQSPVALSSSDMQVKWQGRIARIGSMIDDRTQTVPVFIALHPGSPNMVSGLFLKAEIPGVTIDSGYAIPRRAIYEDDHVYLVKMGRLRYQPVNILRRETDRVIVDGGVQTGDTLVVEVLQGVAPGMPARPRILDVAGGSN